LDYVFRDEFWRGAEEIFLKNDLVNNSICISAIAPVALFSLLFGTEDACLL
jgi:hypothetical protein